MTLPNLSLFCYAPEFVRCISDCPYPDNSVVMVT